MNEPRFITREKLEEIKKLDGNTLTVEWAERVNDFIYTLDKIYLGIETVQSILQNLAEIKYNEKELEQERWKNLGEDLKQLRTMYGMSLNSLAGILDTDWAHIDNAERGLADPAEFLRTAVRLLAKGNRG